MVQIELSKIIDNISPLLNFISHMVQIEPDIPRYMVTTGGALYPTWFRLNLKAPSYTYS